MRHPIIATACISLAIALGAGSAAAQTVSSIKVGGMCDRTGATKIIGAPICSGVSPPGHPSVKIVHPGAVRSISDGVRPS